jgi:hypothetical protein
MAGIGATGASGLSSAPNRRTSPGARPETFLALMRYGLLRRAWFDTVLVARRGKMGHKDHYATLGVPRGAELSLIQATYWRLARLCKAGLTSDPEAPRLLGDLNAAYEVLSTPQLRRQYDELLARAGVRKKAGPRPHWRLGGWRRRPADDGMKRSDTEKAVLQPELAPSKAEPLETSPAAEAFATPPDSEAARDDRQDVREAFGGSKTGAAATSPVRWEMPAFQAIVASTGIAVLGGVALAAGAAPALTLVLGGMALFFCLSPWRFGRLKRLAPRAEHPHPPDEGQRAAALRDSTAAIVARWRQSMALSDGQSWPPTDPGALQPPASHPPADP